MDKRIRAIISVTCFAFAVLLVVISNYSKEREVKEFSYINIWNEDTHYWGYGIIDESAFLCDNVSIYFKEPPIEDVSIHIFYSKGEGLSEENSLWESLRRGKMQKCIDLPNGEYKELRLDIEGNFSIDKVVIEQYNEYKQICIFMALLFLIISVVYGGELIYRCCKLKNWIYANIKAFLIFIIIGILVFSYSVNIWYEIEGTGITSYQLETKYYTQELKSGDELYCFNIDVHDSDLMWLEFGADILEGGDIAWRLVQNQDCISTGRLSRDNYSQGKYKILLSIDTIESVGTYQLEIVPLETTTLYLYVDENNFLKATYYYLFHYEEELKCLLVIIDIIIMLIVIVLLSKLNIYIKYWIMAVSMGILSLTIVIPLSTADEFRHFARAYSVASGQFICEYNEQGEPYANIPANLYNLRYIAPENSINYSDETNRSVNLSRWLYYLKCDDNDETVSAWMGGVSHKGIFEYLPQVISMWIGMILGVKQIWLFYFARIGNWFVVALIWYISIRITPNHKYLFLVLYCMPTNIVYSCTSSTDGLLNAFIMLLISLAIKRYYNNNEFNIKYLVGIIPIATYISIIKFPYILVLFSFIALDENIKDLKNNWKRIIKNIVIVTGVCIISYLLATFLRGFYQPKINTNSSDKIDHIRYALGHMIEVMHIFVQAFMGIVDQNYNQAIFINSFYISVLVLPYSVLMLYSGTIDKNEKTLNKIQIMIMVSVCIFVWVAILIAAYFWTDIGSSYIWGIQGRYLCPIIMTGAITLALSLQNHEKVNKGRYITPCCVAIMMVAFLKIMQMQWF